MSTRTHVIIDHQIDDYRDRAASVRILQPSVPAVIAVDDYWRSVDPSEYKATPTSWTPQKDHTIVSYLDYLGPGGIMLHFSQHVLVVSASARWSGFLTIEPLRKVHLFAFQSIARCVGGTHLVLLPNAGDVSYDAMREDVSQEECISRLRELHGPPQPSAESIPAGAFTQPVPGSHLVWFLEKL